MFGGFFPSSPPPTSDVGAASAYTASAASGSNGFSLANNGARLDFGAGANDYASSNGSTIAFATAISSAGNLTLTGTNGTVTFTNAGFDVGYNATAEALSVRGNLAADSAASDVIITALNTRTAGKVLRVMHANRTIELASVDYAGKFTAAGGLSVPTAKTISLNAGGTSTIQDSSGSILLTSSVANSGSNIAFVLNNSVALSGSTSLLDVRNNGVVKFAVSQGGAVTALGAIQGVSYLGPNGTSSVNLFGLVAAGEATVPDVKITTLNTRTAGKIFSVQNGTTEVAQIDFQGAIAPTVGGTSKPSAAAEHRNKIYIERGGAGVRDSAFICMKSDADAYSWVPLLDGGA